MRDITQLHPRAQALAQKLVAECAKQGLMVKIGECVRTAQEQDELYSKGRTAPGNIVTNCKGSTYSSMHQWGVAFDFYRVDGKGAYYDVDGFFTKVGRIGESLGLEWGGAWTSLKDKPHFQLPDWGSTTSILKGTYKTPEDFKKNWEVNGMKYRVHQQVYGWSKWSSEGMAAGVTGESKRLEALQIDPAGNEIRAKVYIQGIGWKDYGSINKDTIIGTVGQSKRIEALELNGVEYAIHCQKIGWSPYQEGCLGTMGYSYRVESIMIKSK